MSRSEIAARRAEAAAAKTRLIADARLLQARLAPATLAANARAAACQRGERLVEEAKARPVVPAAIAAGTVAFLFRRPAWRAVRRLFAPRD